MIPSLFALLALTPMSAPPAPTPGKCAPIIGGYFKSLSLRRGDVKVELKITRDYLDIPLPVIDCSNPAIYIVSYNGQNYIVDRWAAWVEQDLPICNPDMAGRDAKQKGAKSMLALEATTCRPANRK